MYLLIENQGVCPVEGFTVLGLSTSKRTDLIGQFGSGAKHGVLCCLRAGVEFTIFLGEEKLSFWTKPASMSMGNGQGLVAYKRVGYTWMGKEQELSLSLEFGSIDWKEAEGGFREFVSNALDAVGLDTSKVRVELVNEIEPVADKTRIYLHVSPPVVKFYDELNQWFLHFQGKNKETLLEKKDASKGRVYSKGVFVRETMADAVFDYNFQSKNINESRTMSEYIVRVESAYILRSADPMTVLRKIGSFNDKFEAKIDSFSLMLEKPRAWAAAFEALYPGTYIWDKNDTMSLRLIDKGKRVLVVPPCWMEALKRCGVKDVMHGLYPNKVGTIVLQPASDLLRRNVQAVWTKLLYAGLTNGKSPPGVSAFQNILNDGSEIQGKCEGSTVYILVGQESNKALILEELGHWITGATDATRDFQDWAFKVACHFMGL